MPLQVVVKPPTYHRPRTLAWGFAAITLFAGFLAGSALAGAETERVAPDPCRIGRAEGRATRT